MANAKKRNVYRSLIVWMLVFLALAALACAGYVYTKNYLAVSEQKHVNEVQQINATRTAEYNAAVAELQSQTVETVDDQWPAPAAQGWDVVDVSAFRVNSGAQRAVTRNELLQGGLLLVNRWHAMPADLTDDMMVSVNQYSRREGVDKQMKLPTTNASITMQPVAVEALMQLYYDAREAGMDMDHIIIEEGYRTMEAQSKRWTDELEKWSSRYSGDKLNEKVLQEVAYPGTSDYQSGLSFKVYNYKSGDAAFSNTPLHDTEQGKWLYNNCWKYGYIYRFPIQGFPYPDTVDKSLKTGISVKKVYRYVGVANAAAMNAMGLCLEEYVEYLMAHPHIAVYEDGALRYEIYRMEGGYTDTTVNVPYNAKSFTASTDNVGGLVVAIAY